MRFHRLLPRTGVALCLFVLLHPQLAFGQSATTIRDNGDPANRVDITFLGDGYTANELGQYASDVETAVRGFFDEEPFREYSNYFNVHRVDVTSNESGVDHPERGEFRDTALNAFYNCTGIQRLICVDISKVLRASILSGLEINQLNIMIVIVNDSEYGGSGGFVPVASTHSTVIELVLHELGHSFGLLGDEYTQSPPPCRNTTEPAAPNLTAQTLRSQIKWNVSGGPPTGWIEPSTPIPTTFPIGFGVPGLYEGGGYCITGLYRPTLDSKMRSLFAPFEQINEEQLVKRIYNFVSPLDSSTPIESSLVVPSGEVTPFSVQVPVPSTHTLLVSWFLDGQFETTGLDFDLVSAGLAPGTHQVEVVIEDATEKVRYDPANVMTDGREWTVEILPGFEIDIKPGSDTNPINLKSKGVTPVAILSREGSNALDVDYATVCFGANPYDPTRSDCTEAHGKAHGGEDVDGDGNLDLVLHFDTDELGIVSGDGEACLTGETFGGTFFEACDAIRTVPPCGLGFELALLLPPLMWLRRRRD